MSVVSPPTPLAKEATNPSLGRRGSVLVQNKIAIPGWVCDLSSYRQWAFSEGYPHSGWVAFLNGDIFVDPDMETFLNHNQVKQAFNFGIGLALMNNPSGRFVPDRMLYTNDDANLATEPDGLYAHWATWKSGRLRPVPAKESDYIELRGTPDMVLEIVSNSSEKKDNVTLRELYARAGIAEYWLVDVRVEPIRFEILKLTNELYEPVAYDQGWVLSEVFGCCFQLTCETDPVGQPQFFVKVKAT